jgi:hypothetical protein
MMNKVIVAVSMALALGAPCLRAQEAEVNGVVRDSTGAAIPKAAVLVLSRATGTPRTVTTNASGLYTISSLRPGLYDITVTADGFKKIVRNELELRVAQKATLDFAMELGDVKESVTVVGGNETLETSTAQLGTVISPEKIVDLPLNARNFSQLITLTPGATPVSVAENNSPLFVARVGQSYFPAINGQSNRSNSFTLDGVFNNGHFGGTYAVAPNIDALSEFKVQSHSDLAEFGGVSGGVINLVTRSGTNEFHGSVYEFLRNDALDARGFFTARKPPLRQNQFGATGGGRIIRDRTFFFASYEGYRQVNPSALLTRVPTPEQLAGNFSTTPRQIFDPFSTRSDPNAADRFLRDPFPGNIIPSARLNPSMTAWGRAVIPRPIDTGFAGFNQRNDDPQRFPYNQYNIRGDHRFHQNSSIWGRYTWGEQNQRVANSLPGTYSLTDLPSSNLGVGYVHVFGPSSVLTGLFGYSRMRQRTAPFLTSENLMEKGLFPGLPTGQTFTAPGMGIPSMFGVIPSDTRNRGPQGGYHFQADWSRLVGRHSLKFGGSAVILRYHTDETDGALRFADQQTADLNNPGNTGFDVASFALGVVDTWSYRDRNYSLEAQTWSGYAQDTFKVTDRLTVNLGLRWDLLRNARFSRNFPSMWDFNTGKYIVGSTRPPDCATARKAPCLSEPDNAYVRDNVIFTGSSKFRRDDYKMFGPRFGLAYRWRPSTVIRGGYAILFDLLAGATQQAQNAVGAWPNTALTSSPENRNVITAVANNLTQGRDPRIPVATPLTSYNFYYDPNFQSPYSQQWHLEVQRELPANTQLTMGYVGSHNLRLPIGGDYNTARTPGPGPDRPRALWPNAPVSMWDRSIGQSNYHALQVKLDKRYANGISYLLSYTWSKSIDTGASGQFGVESASLQDPYNPRESRAVSGFDIPHFLSTAVVYELPFGPGKRWLRSGVGAWILGSWQMNSILQLRSGQPYTLFTNADIANIGAVSGTTRVRPDLIGNPRLDKPTPSLWFNTAAYAIPRPFTYGSSGRNQLRSDGFVNMDFSLFREDRIGERVRTQLRVESFNVLNHPTFGVPQTQFSAPNFGRVGSTISTARQIQLGLKVSF